ncbi:hybrid signal transduction histidine kinase M [Tanacetum coccineum]
MNDLKWDINWTRSCADVIVIAYVIEIWFLKACLRLRIVTHNHLLARVPVKLDLDHWNYASWEYIFDKHCQGYEVGKYIHGVSTKASRSTPTPFTPEEIKVDTIVLSWIFTTISESLQTRLFVEHPRSAKEALDIIMDIFKDNKRSRTIGLKAELRSIQIGDMTIDTYFRKIESIATILTTLGSFVISKDVVTFTLEGLPDKYAHVCGIITHREPF